MELYLNSTTHEIRDDRGNLVSVEDAKKYWEEGKVEDANMSFHRLMTFDFDFTELDNFYDAN